MTLRKERFASNPYHTGVFNGADFTISSESDTGTGTGTSNQVVVNVQLKDAAKNVSQRVSGFCYLSDDANGDSVAVTAPEVVSGGVDGTITALVAGKAFFFTSEADGQFDMNIIRTAADTYYLVIVSPDGSRIISEAITFV